jgi:hypothetical protein
MPRVTSHTRSTRKTKYPYTCRLCGQEITAGQTYYEWEKRYGGPQRTHTSCGYPRPSMLSNRKTAVVEDAIQDAEKAIGEWSPGSPSAEELAGVDAYEFSADWSDLESIVEGVADEARSVGEEYESGADNMPDALQYSPTAEAMRDVAQELQDWADNITEPLQNLSDPDIPERDEDEADEDYAGRVEEAIEQWADEARDAAQESFGDLPEYQG